MNRFLIVLLSAFCAAPLFGQNQSAWDKGAATFVSSQNVYVKFASTEGMEKGDTLFIPNGAAYTPALVIKDKSSTSCVCSNLLPEKVKVGTEFFAKAKAPAKVEKEKPKKAKPGPGAVQDSALKAPPVVVAPAHEEKESPHFKQKSKGRISAAAYSNVYGDEVTHRMRYTFSYQGQNLRNSRFSTENYISFRHTAGQWQEVKDNFNNALKVYSLSVKYDFDKRSYIALGRKINPHISSMGAIDGLQVEKGVGKRMLLGAMLGSRPDYTDYRLNLNLLQAGLYLTQVNSNPQKWRETTFAVVEQKNHGKTDRRFAYFQHSNAVTKNLNLFGSFEVDMYQVVNEKVSNAMRLTNLLLSFRYKISKNISVNGAYDNRKNIIYYESYKSYIDQLIDDETRQGLRLGANYRISKKISWGGNVSWRFQKSNPNLSKNLNTYLNINRLPWINASASLSLNLLQTTYLNSRIYGVRFSREIIRGKFNAEWYYRRVEYDYTNYETHIRQDVPGIDLSWNITHQLAFYLYYEGAFDPKNKTLHRINTRIIHRF